MKHFKFYKLGNIPYTVVSGDSVSKIALRYNTTTGAIVEANKDKYPSLVTNPNLIEVGWTFIIPVMQTTTPVNNNTNPLPQPQKKGFIDGAKETFGTTGLLVGGMMLAGIVIVSVRPRKR